jgi:hypothetical protein
VEVHGSGKHSSLLKNGNNYDHEIFLVQTQDPVNIGALNFGRMQELLTKPTSLNINANREAAIIKLFTIVNYHTSLYTLEGC